MTVLLEGEGQLGGLRDRQPDRKLPRSTGLPTVRLCYPGNPVSHSIQSSAQSVFIVPGGQLGRLKRQTGRRGQTDTAAQRTTGHSAPPLLTAMLHATVVLS